MCLLLFLVMQFGYQRSFTVSYSAYDAMLRRLFFDANVFSYVSSLHCFVVRLGVLLLFGRGCFAFMLTFYFTLWRFILCLVLLHIWPVIYVTVISCLLGEFCWSHCCICR
ncbi:hypothetical protein HanHA300_Chr16g0616651 [Helianthus annuus]|nr:hypothetical protein HanHA300_Chr16g0616651 [Helianthus annuus]KAJ0443519.1 hypothetical protein HanIR_Chr16g0821651 [Helianthus annuus]KAJ0461014.1 hypothetical protein HanHA89_Chr16g0667511 [Helianthus annuus]KAJ0645334.1 hypothetical protein HanOQP8_Chr16g0622731 [Helianthus annuus]KAJ0821822.1 hypothetical protein HanPSC8_Chr16g0724691 [Helianthus annuus]